MGALRPAAVKRARAKRSLPSPAERRALREAAGLTQSEVAEAVGLGVNRETVSRWETGKRTPSKRYLPAYLRVLDELRRL